MFEVNNLYCIPALIISYRGCLLNTSVANLIQYIPYSGVSKTR